MKSACNGLIWLLQGSYPMRKVPTPTGWDLPWRNRTYPGLQEGVEWKRREVVSILSWIRPTLDCREKRPENAKTWQSFRAGWDLLWTDISLISAWRQADIRLISAWYQLDISLISGWYQPHIRLISARYQLDISPIPAWYQPDIRLNISLISAWYQPDIGLISAWY